jgi:hypothetical protein
MLHGGGQGADDFAMGTGMNELADRHQCFVLYPQQSSDANRSMCWNWFDESHRSRAAISSGPTFTYDSHRQVLPVKDVFHGLPKVSWLLNLGFSANLHSNGKSSLYSGQGAIMKKPHAQPNDSSMMVDSTQAQAQSTACELQCEIVRELRQVRGDPRTGRRPYVCVDGAVYSSAMLALRTSLIGCEILIDINPTDMRTLRASLPSGESLGLLVCGSWAKEPHSRATRKAANLLSRQRATCMTFQTTARSEAKFGSTE